MTTTLGKFERSFVSGLPSNRQGVPMIYLVSNFHWSLRHYTTRSPFQTAQYQHEGACFFRNSRSYRFSKCHNIENEITEPNDGRKEGIEKPLRHKIVALSTEKANWKDKISLLVFWWTNTLVTFLIVCSATKLFLLAFEEKDVTNKENQSLDFVSKSSLRFGRTFPDWIFGVFSEKSSFALNNASCSQFLWLLWLLWLQHLNESFDSLGVLSRMGHILEQIIIIMTHMWHNEQ